MTAPHQSPSATAVSPAGSVVAGQAPPALSDPQGEAFIEYNSLLQI